MTDAVSDPPDGATRKSKMPLVLGLILGLGGAGAGYAVMSGAFSGDAPEAPKPADTKAAFVPIPPMTIPVGAGDRTRYLRFSAQLEVAKGLSDRAAEQMPRVVDVLNTYLRSVTLAELEDPAALLTLRAQMRRRIDLVVGGDVVRDLLVMEFVIN